MQHIGRNIISLIFSRVLSGIVLFLIYTRLAQYLGPEAAGQYGLLAAYVTVFNFFIDLGMSQLVIKKISEDRTNSSKYLSNYFTVQFILAILFMLIMDLSVLLSNYPTFVKNALYVAGFGLLVSTLSLPARSVISAFQRLTVIAKVNFFNSMINGGMMVLAIVFRQNILFLSFISVSVGLFDFIVYSYLVNKNFTPFKFSFDKVFIKQLFIWTFPFTLLTFFSVYNRVDTLLLSHLRSFVETGYYTAAYKFWDTLAFLPAVIGVSLYPFFAEQLSKGRLDNVKTGLETYTRYMIALAVPLSVGAYMLSAKITLSFYGPSFAPAANALWLLVVAVSLLIIYSPVNSLIISQLTKTATKITGFNLFYNITANLILIPKFGFVAAAAVTVGSELIQTIGYTYIIKKRIVNFTFYRYFIKPIIASLGMAAVIFVLKNYNVWLVIAVGGLVYLVVLFSIKFFYKEDWNMFKSAIDIRQQLPPETL